MPSFDITHIRAQFPALSLNVNGHPAAFFDAPGGTQVPQGVIDAISGYLSRANANCHGAFLTSRRTDETLAEAHAAVGDLLGCDSNEVVFGPNMTALTFALSRSIGRELKPGDEIIVTNLDHDANVAPWRALEERGAVIRVADIRVDDCTLDRENLLGLVNERTRVVAVGYASNAVGTINDVAAITRAAHVVGAMVFVDAVHYAPHGPIDVQAIGCDFLACSAYKFFGPHVGALYGKAEHLERLHPYKVRPAPEKIPDRWETGTQNHEGLAGVIAAIEYLAGIGRELLSSKECAEIQRSQSRRRNLLEGMQAIRSYERGLAEKLVQGLLAIEGLTLYGIRDAERFDSRVPTVALRIAGRHPRAVAEFLAEQGIFVWDGNYYALSLSERLGVESTGGMVRIGLAHYNTAEEIDRLLEALERCREGA